MLGCIFLLRGKEKILCEINTFKATGLDNIAGRFLKDGATTLAKPITKLYNLSILQSKFPDGYKQAKLKPLLKKGAKDDPKKLSTTFFISSTIKIIEIAIHGQVQKYLDEKKILYRYQSGFRAHHSTDTCLSYLSDKILQGFESGMFKGMIFKRHLKQLTTKSSWIKWLTLALANIQ